MDWQPLLDAARTVRERAHAPYSRFMVGAALLAADGTIFTGCNVENRSYGLTVCAERHALGAAVAAGQKRFVALVVASPASPPAPPCGACRESLAELCDDSLPVLMVNDTGDRRELTLGELLPYRFVFPPPAPSA